MEILYEYVGIQKVVNAHLENIVGMRKQMKWKTDLQLKAHLK